MSAEAHGPAQVLPPNSADFRLSEQEIEKGQKAAEAFLSTVKPGDSQRNATEALDTLAAVISDGKCDHRSFPWQQLRAHHSALALSIMKEPGAPARIEAMRCRADDTRKFQQVPDSYTTKVLQRMRSSLVRVIETCSDLGFLDQEQLELAVPPKRAANAVTKSKRERLLTEGEVRALLSACDMANAASAPRDALMISLAYSGGFKTVDLINLSLDSLLFDDKNGMVNIRFKAPGAKRARKIPLQNEDLISLEDWLDIRGREPGPLFCPIKPRTRQVEIKRISAAAMREICNQRAEEAGVLPFSPNDLSRSALPHAENGRGKKAPSKRDSAGVSVLFSDQDGDDADSDELEDLVFPYRSVRTGGQ
ncbi:MAG: hypothetical protein CL917_04620 [Deltaproteobacteria bacterium]|nr:hypothetical protein [Deltaproteobacteria bacterium]